MNKKIIYILGSITVLLIVVAVIGKNRFSDRNTLKVAVATVEKRDIVETVSSNGKIYPVNEVKLSIEVSGEVTRIMVQEGDSVSKGDLLLEINPINFISNVSRAKAGYNQALANLSSAKARKSQADAQFLVIQKDYERKKSLFQQEVISSFEYEQIESSYYTALGEKDAVHQNVEAARYQVESAMATLQEANENLVRTKLYAPMSGVVSKLSVALGEKVVGTAQMAGTQLITIANLDEMELLVDVGENDVLRISLGDTANVEVDAYLGKKFKGVVSHIAYSSNVGVDQQITKFQVKIILLPESYKELVNAATGHAYPFRPGMSATADIITKKKYGVPAVPIQSVTLRDKEGSGLEGKKQIVFVLEGDLVKEYEVETGVQDDRFIEISSGVNDGQKVVSAPFRAISKELKNDKKVSVVEEETLFGKE
jgi:HlyD family secretion protein